MKPTQNILAITVSNTIAVTANGFWIMFLPLFYSSMGLSTPQISLVFSSSSLLIAGFSPIGGKLADRVGRRPVAVFGRYLTAAGPLIILCALIMELDPNIQRGMSIVGYLVLSAGSGLRMPAMSMLLMESSRINSRGRNYMIAERVIPSIPPAASVLIGASLVAANAPVLLFYFGFAGLALSALLLQIALKETLHETDTSAVTFAKNTKRPPVGPFFALLLLAFVMDGISARGVSWYVPIFLGPENVETYGLLISISTLIIALFGLISGIMVDRVGPRYSLIISWLLLAGTVIAFGQAESLPMLLLTYSIWVALDTVDTAVPPVLLSEVYPKEQRATMTGLFRMIVQSSLFLGPLLAGMTITFGSVGPFWMKGAMNVLAASAIAIAFRYHSESASAGSPCTEQD